MDVVSSAYTTLRGARVGLTEQQLNDLYPGELTMTPAKYDPNGHDFTFVPKDAADQNCRMIFLTDGKKVVSFRSGKLPEVEYVEGCL